MEDQHNTSDRPGLGSQRRQSTSQADTSASRNRRSYLNAANHDYLPMDPRVDPSDRFRSHVPELASNSNVAGLAHSSQQYVAPANSLGLMRQVTHRSAALEPSPYTSGNYNSPSQALLGGNQVHVPLYGVGTSSEPLANETSGRSQDSQSGHSGQGSPDSAASGSRPTVSQLPPSGNNGLKFRSLDEALAATENVFRQKLKEIVDDDVDEIERNKGFSVSKIVHALKHTGFMPAPDTKKDRTRTEINLDEKSKAEWQAWQEDARQAAINELQQKNAATNAELRAWQIIEEMVKIHRVGHRFTRQGKDIASKCSDRIDKAVQVIKDYALVRKKLLKGDNISNFCISPASYANTTVSTLWNNSSRGANKESNTPRPKGRRKTPTVNGATALRYEARAAVGKRKRAAKKGKTADVVEAEDTRSARDASSDAPRSNSETSPQPEEAEEAEEVEEADEEYLEGEVEEDAEEDDDAEAEEEFERQRAAPLSAYQQNLNAVFAPTNYGNESMLTHPFNPRGPGFDYLPEMDDSLQQPAPFENTHFQAPPFGTSTSPSVPGTAWANPQPPFNYHVSGATGVTSFTSGNMGLQPGVYPLSQGRQYGYGSSPSYRANSTGPSAMAVPGTSLSEPYDLHDIDQTPPSAKRRKP